MMLADGYSYFPENSVFCVVVDPGVGSERKPLCIRSEHYWFVGPDNGILWQAAERDGICSIFHLDNKGLFLEKVSNTFHGRDVFAPVCARLLKQKATYQPGSRIDECVQYVIPCIKKSENGFEISVVHVDHFGNLVLNIMHKEFLGITTGSSFRFDIGKACVTQIFTHYSQAPDGAPFFISGSSSRMEISIKNADASEQLGVRINQKGNLITF